MTDADKKSQAIEMCLLMQFRDIKNLNVEYKYGQHIITWDKDGVHTENMITDAIEKLKRYSKNK